MTILSIVIPTFEESGIHTILYYLINQSFFKKYSEYIEIIIVDYDPNNTKITQQSVDLVHHFLRNGYNDIKMVPIEEKGIAKARHKGITYSSGKIILNFDADARFKENNGLEMLVDPILRKGYTITCCDNELDSLEFDTLDLGQRITAVAIYETLNAIQRDQPIVTLEPGFCFTADGYQKSGGFFDVSQGEAMVFSPKLIYNQGVFSKKHVPETTVIVSPRRINAIFKFGLTEAINYNNAYRD